MHGPNKRPECYLCDCKHQQVPFSTRATSPAHYIILYNAYKMYKIVMKTGRWYVNWYGINTKYAPHSDRFSNFYSRYRRHHIGRNKALYSRRFSGGHRC